MGHILRTSTDDPLRQVSFLPDSSHRLDYGKKRVGKPRQKWLHHTKKYAHEHVLNRRLYSEIDDDHGISTAAMKRPFGYAHAL